MILILVSSLSSKSESSKSESFKSDVFVVQVGEIQYRHIPFAISMNSFKDDSTFVHYKTVFCGLELQSVEVAAAT